MWAFGGVSAPGWGAALGTAFSFCSLMPPNFSSCPADFYSSKRRVVHDKPKL